MYVVYRMLLFVFITIIDAQKITQASTAKSYIWPWFMLKNIYTPIYILVFL